MKRSAIAICAALILASFLPVLWAQADNTNPTGVTVAVPASAAQDGQRGEPTKDWYDATAGCRPYRGVVNVRDCGAVADGAFVPGGCKQTAPVGCWTGTDNYAAIHKAVETVNEAGGGTVYFPPAGTNVWMVGGPSECRDPIPHTNPALNAMFGLGNGVEIVGSGKSVTVVMAMPETAKGSSCAIFGNKTTPAYNIHIHALRLDGNEGTDAKHTDPLHPNNNFSTHVGNIAAIMIQPAAMGQYLLDTPAAVIERNMITGFNGLRTGNPYLSRSYSAAVWIGPFNWVRFVDNDVSFNQFASALYVQCPDSQFERNYFNMNGDWNPYPTTVESYTSTNRWIDNYWGGGYGSSHVCLGCQQNEYIGNINDAPGPGVRNQCSSTVLGCGSNYEFTDNGAWYSVDNKIIDGTATDTFPGFPAIVFRGHSARNLVEGVTFRNGGRQPSRVPTYLVQETDSASGTTVVDPIIDETPSLGKWGFLSPGPVIEESGITLGKASTELARYARYTQAISPEAVAANTCATQNFKVKGLQDGDVILRVQKAAEQAGLSVTGGRAGRNTATIQFCNNTPNGITPTPNEIYTFIVVQ